MTKKEKSSFAEKLMYVGIGIGLGLLGVKYSEKLPDCVNKFINTKIINK